jgi:hypothetical protein
MCGRILHCAGEKKPADHQSSDEEEATSDAEPQPDDAEQADEPEVESGETVLTKESKVHHANSSAQAIKCLTVPVFRDHQSSKDDRIVGDSLAGPQAVK